MLFSKKEQTMRERIVDLERSISVILRKFDAKEQPEKGALDTLRALTRELRLPGSFKYGTEGSTEVAGDLGCAKDGLEDRGGGLDNAPLVSLFNNFVISREEDSLQGYTLAGDSKGDSNCSNERYNLILRNLRALIPSRAGLSHILQESRISLCLLLMREVLRHLMEYNAYSNGKSFHAVIPYFGKITFRINKQDISQSDLQQAQHGMGPIVERNGDYSALEPTLASESFYQAIAPEAWGMPGEEWFHMVDLGLDEDWNWDFENVDEGLSRKV